MLQIPVPSTSVNWYTNTSTTTYPILVYFRSKNSKKKATCCVCNSKHNGCWRRKKQTKKQ